MKHLLSSPLILGGFPIDKCVGLCVSLIGGPPWAARGAITSFQIGIIYSDRQLAVARSYPATGMGTPADRANVRLGCAWLLTKQLSILSGWVC